MVAFGNAVVDGFQQAVCPVGFGGVRGAGVPIGKRLAVAQVVAVGADLVFRDLVDVTV